METMRREGYEFAVSRPRVVYKTIDGILHEPFETVSIDIDEEHQGPIMEEMSQRQGQMQDMQPVGGGRIQLNYLIPSRGLIGLHTQFLTLTSGTGLIHHIFDHYGKALSKANVSERNKGAMIANCDGVTTAYALWNLQERGQLFIGPQTKVYEGMIIGISSRDDDMVVNPTKAKELTNVRSAGSDDKIQLEPPRELTLEQALEIINDDELVEVTPKTLRLRKKYLKEHERKRAKKR
jgi:GTP-binding protein